MKRLIILTAGSLLASTALATNIQTTNLEQPQLLAQSNQNSQVYNLQRRINNLKQRGVSPQVSRWLARAEQLLKSNNANQLAAANRLVNIAERRTYNRDDRDDRYDDRDDRYDDRYDDRDDRNDDRYDDRNDDNDDDYGDDDRDDDNDDDNDDDYGDDDGDDD